MPRVLVMADASKMMTELCSGLTRAGFTCSIADDIDEITERTSDLLLVELNGNSKIPELALEIKEQKQLPIIALVRQNMLTSLDGQLNLTEDFVIEPYDSQEIVIRAKRLLSKAGKTENNEVMKCGDLTIDTAKYEVSVDGKPINLTFKEYELLKFLASNQGRVFTREVLLNKVWGYDYYGGDRTVDVHITRLRSKLENSNHLSIDTVRNIGYRLRADK